MRRFLAAVSLGLTFFACGGPPLPRESARQPTAISGQPAPSVDDCAPVDGKPAEPLAKKYYGVAAAARCQREVYTIMGLVTQSLGVPCEHCHVTDNYPALTHRKQVANWMARELIPSLEKRGGGATWCDDCHAASGKGRAKLLGDPRSRSFAIEWMSTHLVERFDAAGGKPLRCTMCHVGKLGTPAFDPHVLLTDHLPKRPAPASPAAASPPASTAASPEDAGAPPPDARPSDGG